ncbi:Kinase, NEK [Giardia lamblia P15]|uniref:Kinase, NEK n=1 Tax=Giardia intestinalis (strain P15) TaxID=658858 RepID=E1F6M4_GIAIA|nr:Kinase, NEK [Giardia lamblia P15]
MLASAIKDSIVPEFLASEVYKHLDGMLGKGSSGIVYSIRGCSNFAIKEIQIDGQGEGPLNAFKSKLAALLEFSHPGVLKCHQVIENGSFIYVIMDRYSKALDSFLTEHKRREARISDEMLFSVLQQVADALAYLHGIQMKDSSGNTVCGTVHWDIKPANILLSEDGKRVVVTCFGLYKNALRPENAFVGTGPYAAPEALLHKHFTPASDIWALGVIIYELAILKRPDFTRTSDPKSLFVPGWRPDLSDITNSVMKYILKKIFVLDPGKRPTAKELCDLLQASDASAAKRSPRTMMLEDALDKINARIASLEKTLQAKIDDLEQRFTRAFENPRKPCVQVSTPSASTPALVSITASSTLPKSILDFSWTPLMHAAASGDVEVARKYLSDKDKKNSDGETALMIAARAKHEKIVELLDPTDDKGITTLMRAVDRNDVDTVKVLIPLQKGRRTTGKVEVDELGIIEGTALMRAAAHGYTGIVGLLVEHECCMKDKCGKTALMKAAQGNNPDCVKILLSKEAGMRQNNGWTALMYAAYSNSIECATLLVEKETGMRNKNGRSALMIAVFNNSVDCVKLLLGYEGGMQDSDGWSALMHAARNNKLECVRLLSKKEGCMQDKDGWTALMCAARNDHLECARLLLEKESGMQTNNNETALIMAAEKDHPECVWLLLEREGSMYDKSGRTGLMAAAANNSIECVRLLLGKEGGMKTIDDQTALMDAARNNNPECVNLLIRKEGGMQNKNGETALIGAAQKNCPEYIKLLLEKESNMQDNDGGSALMWAAYHGNPECVKLLLRMERRMRDNSDMTALMWAASCNEQECTQLLVQHEGDASSWTTLIYAAVRGDIDAVRDCLHEAGQQDIGGKTALMYAAARGHIEIVSLLVEKEVCMRDKCGRTALMSAAENNYNQCVDVLLEKEGGMQDEDGWTAMMCAAANNNMECIRLLIEKEARMQDRCGMTALMHAAEDNSISAINIILEHEKGMRSKQNRNALYYALKSEHLKVAKIIIPHEDPTDKDGVTALMRAASRGDIEMVRTLIPLQKGMTDIVGNMAFIYAFTNNHTDTAILLRNYEAPSWTHLMCAAFVGNIEMARKHLSDKDKRNSDGDTALMIAAREGYEDIVELLDPTDENGTTALMRATIGGDIELVKLLAPLQEEMKNSEGYTALMFAAKAGNKNLVELLDPIDDEDSITALMRAAEEDDIENVKLLTPLQAKRKLGYVKVDGWEIYKGTALMIAAAHGHTKIVELLVKHEIGMTDGVGRTALMGAAFNNHPECVKLLLSMENGRKDDFGWTALIYAVSNGSIDTARLLAERERDIRDNSGVSAFEYAEGYNFPDIVSILSDSVSSSE